VKSILSREVAWAHEPHGAVLRLTWAGEGRPVRPKPLAQPHQCGKPGAPACGGIFRCGRCRRWFGWCWGGGDDVLCDPCREVVEQTEAA
jgi:hypothetical protein